MQTASVSPIYYFHVLKIIEEMGLSRQEVSEGLKRDLSVSPSPKTRYSLEEFSDLLVFAADKLKDPHLGLSVGEKFRVTTYTDLGNILAFCKDLEEAAFINRRYSSLVHTLGIPDLTKEDYGDGEKDVFKWVPNFPKEDYQKHRQITEYVMANYVMSLNWLAWGFAKGVTEIHYAHKPAEPLANYDTISRCKSKFETDIYRIVMADNIMNLPLPTANASQLTLLKNKQDAILNTFQKVDNLVLRVGNSVREMILEKRPLLQDVASDLKMGERTLRRHLRDRETNFQDILEDVKSQMCDDLLKDGMSLAEIAQTLWYSDQAAFTRAHKRWHGVAPSKRKIPESNV